MNLLYKHGCTMAKSCANKRTRLRKVLSVPDVASSNTAVLATPKTAASNTSLSNLT